MSTVPLHKDRTLACRQRDVDVAVFYPEDSRGRSAEQCVELAKVVCGRCPRRVDCLRWALDVDERFGVWGGLTSTERAALRRKGAVGMPVAPARRSAPVAPSSVTSTMVAAGRAYMAGGGSRKDVAARFGIRVERLSEAVAVLRWVPEVVADVEAGWVAWVPAYRFSQEVRRWAEATSGVRDIEAA